MEFLGNQRQSLETMLYPGKKSEKNKSMYVWNGMESRLAHLQREWQACAQCGSGGRFYGALWMSIKAFGDLRPTM